MRKQSSLEKKFILLWKSLNGPKLDAEVRFHEERKWRFDFAISGSKIAIELEGGVWSGGRHTRGAGFVKDCEKYNSATMCGWKVIRLTTEQVHTKELKEIIDWIHES